MIHERGLYSEEGSLRPTPPFDFAKSLDFLGTFHPMHEDQTVSEFLMTKAVRVGGRTIVFQLNPTGTIKMPGLRYTLFGDHPFSRGWSPKRVYLKPGILIVPVGLRYT